MNYSLEEKKIRNILSSSFPCFSKEQRQFIAFLIYWLDNRKELIQIRTSDFKENGFPNWNYDTIHKHFMLLFTNPYHFTIERETSITTTVISPISELYYNKSDDRFEYNFSDRFIKEVLKHR